MAKSKDSSYDSQIVDLFGEDKTCEIINHMSVEEGRKKTGFRPRKDTCRL